MENDPGIVNVEALIEPVVYTVRETKSGPWWWRQKEWWIDYKYGSIGPYYYRNEVIQALNRLNK